MRERGQIFSTDFLIAISVFMVVLILSIAFLNDSLLRVESIERFNGLQEAAAAASDSLVLSVGVPFNWQNKASLSDVNAIGLADSANFLDSAKLQRFSDLNASDYNAVKEILGVSKFGLFVSINSLQNSQRLFAFGLSPDSNAEVASIQRLALLGNEDVLVNVKVFK
ncbi:MAG: hypothetical protein V1494_01690 [Candidatus Diapherotrites archaeon]